MKSIESHLTSILAFTLLSAIGWSVITFLYGYKLLPSEIDYTEILFESSTVLIVFVAFGISITLDINLKYKRLINIGFLMLFLAFFQDLLDEIILLEHSAPRLIEDVGIPLGFTFLTLGLFGLGKDFKEYSRQLIEIQKREHQLNITDKLTGLINREQFLQALPPLLSENNANKPLIALRLTFENLQQINDEQGYAIGDLALQEFSNQLLRTKTEFLQLAARLKGRLFVLILAEQSLKETNSLAETLAENCGLSVIDRGQANKILLRPQISHEIMEINNQSDLDEILR